jgi:hypothetical protein
MSFLKDRAASFTDSESVDVFDGTAENGQGQELFFIHHCIDHGLSALSLCSEKVDPIASS